MSIYSFIFATMTTFLTNAKNSRRLRLKLSRNVATNEGKKPGGVENVQVVAVRIRTAHLGGLSYKLNHIVIMILAS